MKLAIIGSGATAIYILKHLSEYRDHGVSEIHIFEKESLMGMGMPYNPIYTDKYHLANITSEEIPLLTTSFSEWLRAQSAEVLNDLAIERDQISDNEVYSRIALGRYLHDQYTKILDDMASVGTLVFQYPGIEVIDIADEPNKSMARIYASDGSNMVFDHVFISTGHNFDQPDKPASGYFKSPWPIEKILPQTGTFYNFEIGLLGASLSAFDVVTSLVHRHGRFMKRGDRIIFKKHPSALQFKIKMHSAEGWLPHLQYEQKNPMREIYRYISRDGLLKLCDNEGRLRIDDYFDALCRPVLRDSLSANGYEEAAELLNDQTFKFSDFIEKMSERHEYENPFEGMVEEMRVASTSVNEDIPIYWKEAMDDLMYTLNFHMEMLPAEDQIFFRESVMPFLLNVIAALPLQSAKILLALHDAGVLDLIKGKIENIETDQKSTRISVVREENTTNYNYRIFIECGGDKKINLESYPFQSLVKDGLVRASSAAFANVVAEDDRTDETVFKENGKWFKTLPGIDVDSAYRVIGSDGRANPRIYDPTFTHIQGVRPYSYGLQACNTTAEILVQHFIKNRVRNSEVPVSAKDTN